MLIRIEAVAESGQRQGHKLWTRKEVLIRIEAVAESGLEGSACIGDRVVVLIRIEAVAESGHLQALLLERQAQLRAYPH